MLRIRRRGQLPLAALLAALASLGHALLPPVAAGVIIASGDGTGNTEPPADDPGFHNVGAAGVSVVYIGNGWILTTNHTPTAGVILAHHRYRAVPASRVRFRNPDTELQPDLAAWKIDPLPDLPALRIRSEPPEPYQPVVLIGRGRDRGERVQWQGFDGWHWGERQIMRWGTNRIQETSLEVSLANGDLTWAFSTDFSSVSPTEHEAQVATGDSGGGAFVRSPEGWELAGILFASSGHDAQPPETALFGNRSLIVDLSHYYAQIVEIRSRPACADGVDDDGDGRVDHPDDPGCESSEDDSEREEGLPCDDARDNDGDRRVDFPDDPGCGGPADRSERVACRPGLPRGDVDGDGRVDGVDYVRWTEAVERAGDEVADADSSQATQPADLDCDGSVNAADYALWRAGYPGPPVRESRCGSGALLGPLLVLLLGLHRRGQRARRRRRPRPAQA